MSKIYTWVRPISEFATEAGSVKFRKTITVPSREQRSELCADAARTRRLKKDRYRTERPARSARSNGIDGTDKLSWCCLVLHHFIPVRRTEGMSKIKTFGQVIIRTRRAAGLTWKAVAERLRGEDSRRVLPPRLNNLEHDRRHPPEKVGIEQSR